FPWSVSAEAAAAISMVKTIASVFMSDTIIRWSAAQPSQSGLSNQNRAGNVTIRYYGLAAAPLIALTITTLQASLRTPVRLPEHAEFAEIFWVSENENSAVFASSAFPLRDLFLDWCQPTDFEIRNLSLDVLVPVR